MRIGIDARKEWDGGIGRYIRNLVSGLEGEDEITQVHAWVKPGSEMFRKGFGSLRPHVERAGLYSLWEQVSLGQKIRRFVMDLFHEPHYVIPLFLRIPLIVTIHDIIHLVFPRTPVHKLYAYKQIRYAVRRARVIITPSEFSRRELIKNFPEVENKCVVIFHGLEAFFSPEPTERDKEIKDDLKLPDSFLFYVGNHKPHKNLQQLLEVCREIFKGFPDLHLCLTGARGDEGGTVYRTACRYGIEHRVRFLGKLENEALSTCYRHARVFVFPSLYEGFGFPPLEAMACGTPVVAFATASLPEVIGKGGLLVQPRDGKAFYQALFSILEREDLRRSWGEKGLVQARKFRWERSIREHLSIYRQVLSESSV